jgi:hypothetical protein
MSNMMAAEPPGRAILIAFEFAQFQNVDHYEAAEK